MITRQTSHIRQSLGGARFSFGQTRASKRSREAQPDTGYQNPGIDREIHTDRLTSGLPYQRPVNPKEDNGNVVDYYYGITEMLEHIDIQEMPRIYGYLKEMYFSE